MVGMRWVLWQQHEAVPDPVLAGTGEIIARILGVPDPG
jgi:hypothetical protein